MDENQKPVFRDVTAEVFGKYRLCMVNEADGLSYAFSDFDFGELKAGALPSPLQGDAEKSALARQIHEKAAQRQMESVLMPKKAPLRRIKVFGAKIRTKLGL